ncbi:melanophilin isoform X2 [Pleurodeles waltl]|uniref:melanophilin isoform X2 n=1 Tax=Pleurodeles waltl TaxID=8319 RepID=UPI003709C536
MGRKLDLSKLTDDEARHVWEVIQRDFDLRKKEEERLEDLKGKVEKESTKRELICNQAQLNETHCVHCLQPFKFLVNSKRQCLDCRFYSCKNCSRYNKKEQGWVCDACRVTRVVKIGSLEWFYEHVRTRFKRFGSAKVMRSLYGRLQPGQNLDPELLGEYLRQVDADMFPNDIAEDDDEAQRYSLMRKTKRLLSVHPFDFELDSEYSAQSRRPSVQFSLTPADHDVAKSFSEFSGPGKDTLQKESMIAEAELAAMFHHILQEQGHTMEPPDQEFSTEVRLTVNSRRRSTDSTHRLDTNTVQEQPQVARTTAPTKGALPSIEHRPQYSGDMDTSEEETKGAPRFPAYHPHHFKRRSRTSSQESGPHSGVQMSELNRRMYAIERMLNRLEEKISGHSDESPSLEPQTDADLEEVTLKRKLGELASNISDKEVSSEEEPEKKVSYKPVLSSSSDDLPTEAQKRSAARALCDITAKAMRVLCASERAACESLGVDSHHPPTPALVPLTWTSKDIEEAEDVFQNLEERVYLTAGKTFGLERRLQSLEEKAQQSGTTDSELSELEIGIASSAAIVQQTESEVSDIESRIAALSAAGMTVSPADKPKRRSTTQTSIPSSPSTANAVPSPGSRQHEPLEIPNLPSTEEVKVTPMQQALRKKFNVSLGMSDSPDGFDRNAIYRGSLTQRNPNGKNKKLDRIFAKPVLTHR